MCTITFDIISIQYIDSLGCADKLVSTLKNNPGCANVSISLRNVSIIRFSNVISKQS